MYGLLDSRSWCEGELGKDCKGMTKCFLLKAMVRFHLESISEHPMGWTVWGKGTEKRLGGLNNRCWWMEIRFSFCLCERWADAVLEGCRTAQSAGSGGKVRRGCALSPVCPGGSHVYDGRTPAASPKPSSQMPGSYCFSPFGCPARGWNADRYLHWGHGNHSISFPQSARHIGNIFPNHWGPISFFLLGNHVVWAQILPITCWQNVASYKCLPPCFLLSSPFWSPFFGCSLGLWGCCEMKANMNKGKQQTFTDWEENEDFREWFSYLGSWLLVRLITWK